MTGTMWESTPVGRPGGQLYFLRAGHDVCVSDGTERGRASFAPPGIWNGEPVFMSKQFLWHHARIGTHHSDGDRYTPFPGVLFPIERIDELPKQHVAAWPWNAPRHVDAYDALVERIGPCVILLLQPERQLRLGGRPSPSRPRQGTHPRRAFGQS